MQDALKVTLSEHDPSDSGADPEDAAIVSLKLGYLCGDIASEQDTKRNCWLSVYAGIRIGLEQMDRGRSVWSRNPAASELIVSLQEHKTLIHNQTCIDFVLTGAQTAESGLLNQ